MELKLILSNHYSFLQWGRIHKCNYHCNYVPISLPQLPDPFTERCLPIVSWLSHRPRAQKQIYQDRDLSENKELLKPGILLQRALCMTETLKQIRLCTDGSAAPIVNCGTRAWDDNHFLFIKDCVFCEDPSIPRGLNNNEIYSISHTWSITDQLW